MLQDVSERPTFMEAAKAGEAIRAKVDGRAPLTVADAAAQTGLALRDADSGEMAVDGVPRAASRDPGWGPRSRFCLRIHQAVGVR